MTEKKKAAARKYYFEHREVCRAATKRYYRLHRKQRQRYRKQHMKAHRKYQREYCKQYPERRMLYSARHHAKTLGLPCTIVLADIRIPKVCPILGVPIFKNGDERVIRLQLTGLIRNSDT